MVFDDDDDDYNDDDDDGEVAGDGGDGAEIMTTR